jgi:hypothetical protein
MVFSIGFVLNWIQNLKNFGIIKVGNKYFWIWLVNMVLKSTFSLEDLMNRFEWSYNIKIDHCIFKGRKIIIFYFFG